MKIPIIIRFAQPDDIEDIINLCQEHADFEKTEYDKNSSTKRLAKGLFGTNKKLECLVVESDGELIGYATYMTQYATWNAEEYIYMDCLYLKEFSRGLGIGEKLVYHIRNEAEKKGVKLIQWQTPDFNIRAVKFYSRLGAVSKSKERFFLTV